MVARANAVAKIFAECLERLFFASFFRNKFDGATLMIGLEPSHPLDQFFFRATMIELNLSRECLHSRLNIIDVLCSTQGRLRSRTFIRAMRDFYPPPPLERLNSMTHNSSIEFRGSKSLKSLSRLKSFAPLLAKSSKAAQRFKARVTFDLFCVLELCAVLPRFASQMVSDKVQRNLFFLDPIFGFLSFNSPKKKMLLAERFFSALRAQLFIFI
jgi:hypothetical protein